MQILFFESKLSPWDKFIEFYKAPVVTVDIQSDATIT